jgi:hypothetical protein
MNPYNTSHFQFVNKHFKLVENACTAVSIPAISLASVAQSSRFASAKHPGDKLEFSDMSITFLVDEDLKNYNEISDWLMSIQNTEYKNIKDKISDSKILVHNSSHKLVGTYTFTDSFPISLSGLDLQTDATSITYPKITVDFAYTSFSFERA